MVPGASQINVASAQLQLPMGWQYAFAPGDPYGDCPCVVWKLFIPYSCEVVTEIEINDVDAEYCSSPEYEWTPDNCM